MKNFTLAITIFSALVLLAGCENKQEVAQEQSKEVLKKMFSKPAEVRTYDQLLKEELANTAQQASGVKGVSNGIK